MRRADFSPRAGVTGAPGPKGHIVAKAVPVRARSGNLPAPRRRPGAGSLLTLVNGVLAGVGGVYVGTHSALITVIAAGTAIILAAMTLIWHR